ncbi:type II restriction endonuclease [Nitrincola schmidtii]|uniref:type II restriction endonuclease n=1 Tax=Nitrincola schmidtii TaxID=1730894 RepID=UPI00124DE73A
MLIYWHLQSSCKDRWRQVLAEADRVKKKHLLTLEAAISKSQTDEMQSKQLQLVIPKALHDSYLEEQKAWLLSVSDFSSYVLERQIN